MTTQTESFNLVATGLPATIEDYQLALNVAFAGGKTVGKALAQQSNEQVEPAFWYSAQEDEFMTDKIRKEHERLNSYTHKVGKFDLPLYTHPPVPTAQPEQELGATTEASVHAGLQYKTSKNDDFGRHQENKKIGCVNHDCDKCKAQRKPLTRNQVKAIMFDDYKTATMQERADFMDGFRAAEAAHGIEEQP